MRLVWRGLRLGWLSLYAACAALPPDARSGADVSPLGAQEIELDQEFEGRAEDIVSYSGGDRTDWKQLVLAESPCGYDVDIHLTWKKPRDRQRLALRVYDSELHRLVDEHTDAGAAHAKLRTTGGGRYYLELLAERPRDAGTYTVRVVGLPSDRCPEPKLRFGSGEVTGKIVDCLEGGTVLRCTLDVGKARGVAVGWRGMLVNDADDVRAGVLADVVEVGEEESVVRVWGALTRTDLEGYGGVYLSPALGPTGATLDAAVSKVSVLEKRVVHAEVDRGAIDGVELGWQGAVVRDGKRLPDAYAIVEVVRPDSSIVRVEHATADQLEGSVHVLFATGRP